MSYFSPIDDYYESQRIEEERDRSDREMEINSELIVEAETAPKRRPYSASVPVEFLTIADRLLPHGHIYADRRTRELPGGVVEILEDEDAR